MKHSRRAGAPGFTLVELLVSTAIITLLMLMLMSMTNQTSALWQRTTGKLDQFRQARAAFETMTTRLSQATLNVYWDYDSPTAPTKYQRRSELRFLSGPADEVFLKGAPPLTPPSGKQWVTHAVFFQAPFGITQTAGYKGFETMLNTWGYYLEYSDDSTGRPAILPPNFPPARWRYRLMEFRQPSENMMIFTKSSGPGSRTYSTREWFRTPMGSNPPVRPVADNIIALIITPRLARADEAAVKVGSTGNDESPLAPAYLYDSAPFATPPAGDTRYKDGRLNPIHQLPPLLDVTMVAIDETTASRMNFTATTSDAFDLKTKFIKGADFDKDLRLNPTGTSLEETLINKGASYRIMRTSVLIRGAKWSSEQTN